MIDVRPAADFLKSTYQLEQRQRCQEERQRVSNIVREYLEESFRVRIRKAQDRAMVLQGEAVSKPEYKLAADEAQKYVTELERSRDDRLAGVKRLEIARTGPIQHIATALVLSPDESTDGQLRAVLQDEEPDPNIRRQSELAAEDKVIGALIEEGFPADRIERVGHLKLGFDIRAHRVRDKATGEIEVRRIEVKGRKRGQPIRLTTNEWLKAQQLADTYWLSVVWDSLTEEAELVSVRNPAQALDHAKKEILATRFYEIPASAIEQRTETVVDER